MNTHKGRHIFWIVFSGMICLISACNDYSVSKEQAESFLKYYAIDVENHTGTEVIQTSDGGYAILCNYENPDQNGIFVIITDEFGRQKTDSPYFIGTPGGVHGYSMIEIDDGYLIAGSSAAADSIKGYLVVISSDGTILREKNYGGYKELEFRNVYKATDGNLILTGYRKNNSGDDTEVILFKISAEGEVRWRRGWGWAGDNYIGDAVIEFQKRYHIISTATDVIRPNLSNIRMINTNQDGKGETSELIAEDYLSGKDIAVNFTSGNMYILGNLEDNSTRESNIYLAELELTGQDSSLTGLGNSMTISNPDYHAASFVTANDNDLAIGGLQINDNNILFLLVDNSFHELTWKIYGSKSTQASQSIIHTRDGGFALTGSVDMVDRKTSMLLKIDSDGELR